MLHYEEVAKFFPQELNWKFKVYQFEGQLLATILP